MAVTIDNAWLANAVNGGPDGPWLLNVASETYNLTVNATAPGTAFAISQANIIFDLGGNTVIHGSRTQPTILNPFFSDNTAVPGKPDNWDVTGAPTATVVPISTHAKAQAFFSGWGVNCLRLGPLFTAAQVILSDPITLPATGVVYGCCIFAIATSGGFTSVSNLQTSVVDSVTGLPASGVTAVNTNTGIGSGYAEVLYFTPTALPNPVRIKITVTPPSTGMTAYIGRAELKTSRHYGVNCSRHPGLFTVRNGIFINSNETPDSPCIRTGDSNNTVQINDITATSAGLDSRIFNLRFSSGIVEDCTLIDGGTLVSNRQRLIPCIEAANAYQGGTPIIIRNNTISNCKQIGIVVSRPIIGSRIHNNTISPNSRYTNCYCINAYDVDTGLEIDNNVLHPVNGRGIIIDQFSFPWGNILIHDNDIDVYERGNAEFGAEGLETTGIRLRSDNLGSGLIDVYDNTILARSDANGSHACECIVPTIRNAGTTVYDWRFRNNYLKAITSHPSAQPDTESPFYATAFAVMQSRPPGKMTITGNTFESNCVSLAIGGADSFAREQNFLTFLSNTFVRNTTEGTQVGYLPVQIGPWQGTVGDCHLRGSVFVGQSSTDFSLNAYWDDQIDKLKVIDIAWLMTITVLDSVTSLPLSGVTCITRNAALVQDDSEATDATGVTAAFCTTDLWSRPGSWAQGSTHTTYGPHTLVVSKPGYTTQTINLGSLSTNGTLTVHLVPSGVVMPTGGFSGLLDFAGYPVGAEGPIIPPLGPALGGFIGLLDFAGYPVGGAAQIVVGTPPTIFLRGNIQRNVRVTGNAGVDS